MTSDDWARLELLFEEARQRSADERAAWLLSHCPDAAMRALLSEMLATYDADPEFLEASTDVAGSVAAAIADGLVGARLGPYRITSQIGRGGMGVVYDAVRDDGDFERRVAIKVLPTWSGAALTERFRLERRVLAALDHPGIARLVDSGTTPDGAPYFVMEFVDGLPIDVWARDRRLDVRARIAIVARVCDAVAYAHQHLVVHRDIKPANILVTADGHPRLLDFGIATLLSDPDGADTGATQTNHQRFTIDFASPEQIKGEAVTTASDVYSLGVLLYLLVSGRRPFSLKHLSPLEAMRTVCEVDPPPPSTVAASDDAPKIRGDLDAVIGKALSKAPRDRYATVAALASDLEAFRSGLPVSAAPEPWARRVRRFVRRNKAAALVLAAIVAGGGAAVWQARVAATERDRADSRFNDVRRLANAVVGPLYDEIAKVPGSIAARRALVTQALAYLDSLESQAADDLALKTELAEAYQKIGDIQGNPFQSNLGDLAGAKASYATLARLRRAVAEARPDDHRARLGLADAYAREGDVERTEGRYAEGVRLYERAVTILESTAGSSEPRLLAEGRIRRGLGLALAEAGRPDDARRQLEAAVALFERDPPRAAPTERSWEHIAALIDLSKTLSLQGRSDDALPPAEQAMAMARSLASATSDTALARRTVYQASNALCNSLDRLGRTDDCIPIWNEGVDAIRALADADPTDVRLRVDMAVAYHGLAVLHGKKARMNRAAEAIDAALATWTSVTKASPDSKVDRFNYALAFSLKGEIEHELGRFPAAIEAHLQALEIFREPDVAAKGPVETVLAHEAYGDTLSDLAKRTGRPDDARQAREAYETAHKGYAQLKEAGQLPQGLAEQVARVAQKLAARP